MATHSSILTWKIPWTEEHESVSLSVTQGQCLLEELLAQLGAAEANEAGVVLHTGGVGDLAAEGGPS